MTRRLQQAVLRSIAVRHALAALCLAALACEAGTSGMELEPPDTDGESGDGEDGWDAWRPEWPEFDVRYETEHIRVAPSFTQPICQGSLDAMERHVVMVADQLEIEPPKITVFWFNDKAEGANLDEPHGDCFPCYKLGAVYSYWGDHWEWTITMMHELVHGTLSPVLGRGDVTLGEAAANAFNGRPTTNDSSVPSGLIGDTKQGGSRFFRWLLDERGPDVIKELFAAVPFGTGNAEGIAAFGEVLGEDLYAVEAEFLATAPAVYPAPGLCDGLPEVAWEDATWAIDTEVDCRASNVFGPTDGGGLGYIAVIMDVPAEVVGRELDVMHDHPDTPWVNMVPCLDEPTDDPGRAEFAGFSGSEWLAGMMLPYAMRYRVEIPADPNGRANVRLQLLEE